MVSLANSILTTNYINIVRGDVGLGNTKGGQNTKIISSKNVYRLHQIFVYTIFTPHIGLPCNNIIIMSILL